LELEKVAKDLVKMEEWAADDAPKVTYYRANAEFRVAAVQNEKIGAKKALAEAAKRQLFTGVFGKDRVGSRVGV
jgi:hypothetical protein